MPDPAILRALFGRPPADAIAFLKSKGLGLTWNFQEMQDDAHARTFTVAKAGKLDILADIRGALVDNLEAGGTLDDFKRNLIPTLRAKGWWGKQVAVDPDTLDAELVQLGSVRRLKTIYQTNVQSAYMAGRYKRQMEADAFPYLQYLAVMDGKTRPSHSLLHGKIWRKDDPVWDTIYPPRGYNCRCRARALTAGQIEREGLAVSEPAETVSREVRFGADKVTGEAFRATQTGVKVKDALGKPVISWTDAGFNGSPSAGHPMDERLLKSARRALGDEVAWGLLADTLTAPPRIAAWRGFVDTALRNGVPQRQTMTLGLLPRRLASDTAAVVFMQDRLLAGKKARRHADEGDALTRDEWLALPGALRAANWYADTRNNNLVALIAAPEDTPDAPPVAVVVDGEGRVVSAFHDGAAAAKIRNVIWKKI